MTGMTVQVVALLGGATHQAVSQAESPQRWLDYRIRLSVFPASIPSRRSAPAYQRQAVKQAVLDKTKAMVQGLRPVLEGLQEARRTGRRGRPGKLTLAGFRAFLGVKAAEGPTFLVAFARYCKKVLDKLFELLDLLRGVSSIQRMSDLTGILDTSWLPTHPRDGCPLVAG